MKHRARLFFWLLFLNVVGAGCQSAVDSAYYRMWEALGREKRDLLVAELGKTNDEQTALKEHFTDTLERIRTEYSFTEGALGDTYDALSDDYETAKSRAEKLREGTQNVKSIAAALFEEWEAEAQEMDDAELRNSSLEQLEQSRASFAETQARLDEVLMKIDPVLKRLHDHVLHLKHNLNARAVGGLETRLNAMAPEIEQLIRSMEASIESAKEFESNLSE